MTVVEGRIIWSVLERHHLSDDKERVVNPDVFGFFKRVVNPDALGLRETVRRVQKIDPDITQYQVRKFFEEEFPSQGGDKSGYKLYDEAYCGDDSKSLLLLKWFWNLKRREGSATQHQVANINELRTEAAEAKAAEAKAAEAKAAEAKADLPILRGDKLELTLQTVEIALDILRSYADDHNSDRPKSPTSAIPLLEKLVYALNLEIQQCRGRGPWKSLQRDLY